MNSCASQYFLQNLVVTLQERSYSIIDWCGYLVYPSLSWLLASIASIYHWGPTVDACMDFTSFSSSIQQHDCIYLPMYIVCITATKIKWYMYVIDRYCTLICMQHTYIYIYNRDMSWEYVATPKWLVSAMAFFAVVSTSIHVSVKICVKPHDGYNQVLFPNPWKIKAPVARGISSSSFGYVPSHSAPNSPMVS